MDGHFFFLLILMTVSNRKFISLFFDPLKKVTKEVVWHVARGNAEPTAGIHALDQ